MSLSVCVQGLLAEGKISKGQGEKAEKAYDRHFQRLKHSMSEMAASAQASEMTLRELKYETDLKERRAVYQMAAQAKIAKAKPGVKLYEQVEFRRRAVRSQAFGMMTKVLATFKRDVLGEVRNKAQLEELVRARFGEATGNINAHEMSDAFGDTAEFLRKRFNAAGGDIGKIDGWGLPQSHDSRAVRAAGFAAWRNATLPLLDRARMIDDRTGLPFDDGALDEALRDVWETIRTEGWSKRAPGSAGKGSLANRYSESRFLHFANADAWLAYADQFGTRNAFDAMLGHVEAMSRDIAAMEMLGPNPAATVKWHKDLVQKEAALDVSPGVDGIEQAGKLANKIDSYWREYTGENRRPESRKIALGFGALRSLQVAAKLGGAVVTALPTDLGAQFVSRNFNKISGMSVIPRYLSTLNPLSAEDRLFATRGGIIADTWVSMGAGQNRFLGEELTAEWARRLAEFVLRVSGLNAWTDGGRWVVAMDMLSHVTLNRALGFDQLDAATARAFEAAGITPAHWDKIRAAPLIEHKGQPWIVPSSVEDGAAADALLEWILRETDYAVPTPDLGTRAAFGQLQRGTLLGEVGHNALQFKSFGLSMMMMQMRRMMEIPGNWNRARYAATFLMTMWAAGAVALQLKEVAKGKDPRPMDDPKFWGAAFLTGGGLGMAGDLLGLASDPRLDSGALWLAGPSMQTLASLGNATAGNVVKALDGDADTKTDFGKDMLRMAKSELPGGNVWYSKLAFERILLDELQQAVDPDYRQAWRRTERRAKDQGQEFYWAPGDDLPSRAPDFGNLTGDAVATWGDEQ